MSSVALPRGWAWLLWLALLLPLAQAAAFSHAYSHDAQRSGDISGKQALPGDTCGLCLTGAALCGGAAAAEPIAFISLAGTDRVPAVPATGLASIAPAHRYLSRAPPSFLL